MTTWDGFERFAATPTATRHLPGTPPRGIEERLAYHSQFVTVRTPAIDALSKNVRTLMILGRHQHTTARPSLIVTGPAAAGKTTALLQIGRACHLAHQSTPHPTGRTYLQVPVAYILVPPAASAKTLAAEFAHYLGIPLTPRMSQAEITHTVCHSYAQAGVKLVMIDEIHRLNPRTTNGAQSASDLLKDLTERIGATFVYAGIDVTNTPLFNGVRGAQLAGRASLIECGPLPARLGTQHPFTDVVTDLENALDLHHHKPGTLPRHAVYLHQRTAGRIGSLTRLIRQAAITAITAIHDETERITKTTLDAIRLDHHAETTHQPPTGTWPVRTGGPDGLGPMPSLPNASGESIRNRMAPAGFRVSLPS
ncbi:TniB family NTP-binding protein [Streptomyces sp. NPDC127051]|uniref:TniB family NTP-binding protein n=1 Tax=Streptomyces sp. NPDC127051 TaxID=3347119 RepID=UPI003669BB46